MDKPFPYTPPPPDPDRAEREAAYLLFISLPSAYFFSWTTKVAGFDDQADEEAFRRQFPTWEA
jgi:hypothetical protein